jgi:hypothetical protein
VNGQSAFVLELAARLIASGGRYANRTLTDVVVEILQEADELDHVFAGSFGNDEQETTH